MRQTGQQRLEQRAVIAQHTRHMTAAEHFAKFRPAAFYGDLRQCAAFRQCGHAQHAQHVLGEAARRFAHAAQAFCRKVCRAAEGIDQPGCGRIGHGVDGKITPGQVVGDAAHESHAVRTAVVGVRAVGAESRYLIGRVLQQHRYGAVAYARRRKTFPGKRRFDLPGAGGGAHVPVVGRAPHQAVPHAAAHRKGGMPLLLQRA